MVSSAECNVTAWAPEDLQPAILALDLKFMEVTAFELLQNLELNNS